MSLWIADTSPLIFLAKLDRLDLLRQSADEVLVPPGVVEEIRRYQDEALDKIEEALGSWLGVRPVAQTQILGILLADLDSGEAEAVALALELRADRLVIDDLDARRLARRLGLAQIGTLGLLLAARLRGELPSLKLEIERLRQEGFRVADSLALSVLRTAGEE